jgi:hypothetical protein
MAALSALGSTGSGRGADPAGTEADDDAGAAAASPSLSDASDRDGSGIHSLTSESGVGPLDVSVSRSS